MAWENYPALLPSPRWSGTSRRQVAALKRTKMISGRTRQRRGLGYVPELMELSWQFTGAQCALFESWFAEVLIDGSLWWRVAAGDAYGDLREVRFVSMYEGPTLSGLDTWAIRASVESRPLGAE